MDTLSRHSQSHSPASPLLFVLLIIIFFVISVNNVNAAQYILQSAHIDGRVHTTATIPTPVVKAKKVIQKTPTPTPSQAAAVVKAVLQQQVPKRIWQHKEVADAHIVSLVVSTITTKSAHISYTTDEPAYSYIEFVVVSDDAYERQEVSSTPTKEHNTSIVDLYPGVEYKVRIITAREDNSIIESRETSFKTLPITTLPSIKLNQDDEPNKGTVSKLVSRRLVPSKSISIVNIVNLIKEFDANSFAQLYSQATPSQRTQMMSVEPALFTQSGLLNADVFRSLNPTKHSLLLTIVDALPSISVANNLLSTESKLDAAVQGNDRYNWSAYAGSKIKLTIKDSYFATVPDRLMLIIDDAQYGFAHNTDSWEAVAQVPYATGPHKLMLEAQYADAISVEYKAKLQVSNLSGVVGQEGGAWGKERVRLSSSLVDLYKRTDDGDGSQWWQRYTQEPYITNQNGEFAASLPVGEYKVVVTKSDGSQETSEQSIVHTGGMLSASVLMSGRGGAISSMSHIVQYMLIILLLIAFAVTVQGRAVALMRKLFPKLIMLLLIAVPLLASSTQLAYASSQKTIIYNGVLATQSGTNAGSQRVNMNFSFYDAEFDGQVRSSFSRYVVVNANGAFSVALPVNKLKVGKEYWVALRIAGDDLGRSRVVLEDDGTTTVGQANGDDITDGEQAQMKGFTDAVKEILRRVFSTPVHLYKLIFE